MAFNYQAAKQAGYSDTEINAYLRNQGATVLSDLSTTSPTQQSFGFNSAAAKAAGYSPESISEYSRGGRTGIPGMAGSNDEPFLSKLAKLPGQVGNFAGQVLLPRGIAAAKQIGGSLLINQNLTGWQQKMEDNQRQIVSLQDQARRTTDVSQSQRLNAAARDLNVLNQQMMSEYVQAAHTQSGVTAKTKLAGDWKSALSQGLGVGGEIGALMAPMYGRGAPTAGARIAGAVKGGMIAGGISGGTDPNAENLTQRVRNAERQALISGATSGVLATGGEAVKKLFGAKVKSVVRDMPETSPEKATEVAVVAGPVDSNRLTTGGKVYRSQFTIPPKLAKRLRTNETVNTMMRYNVTGNLDDLAAKADVVTGGDGVITKMTRDAIGFNNAVIDKTDDAIAVATQQSAISPFATPEQKNIALQQISSMISDLHETSPVLQNALPGQVPTNLTVAPVNAVAAYDVAKNLEKEGYNLLGKSTYLTERLDAEDMGKMYLAAADHLMDQIDDQAGKAALDAVKNPENIQRLAEVSPQLAKEVMAAKTVRELRSLAAPFVSLKKMVELTDEAAMSAFNGLATALGGGKQGIAGIDLTKPGSWVKPLLESQAVNTAGGTILDKFSQAKQGSVGQFVTGAVNSNPANWVTRALSLTAAREGTKPATYH